MPEKVYVITGASSGIGVGIAECLVKSGVKNLVLVARRKDKLEEVAASCKSLGADEVLVLQKDLSNLDSCPEIVVETINKFGRLDVLVNNAGIADNSKHVSETTNEEAQKIFTVNFFAPLALTREALPHIRNVKGNVVFISSVSGHNPVPRLGPYCASKAALASLAKTIALEEAPNGVRINIISPGVVLSEITALFLGLSGKTEDETGKVLSKMQPLPHAGLPRHIGDAVVYLTSDATGHFATGTDLVIDGGLNLNPFHGINQSDKILKNKGQ